MREKKVYIINCSSDFDFRGAEYCGDYGSIKDEAERQGGVYSLDWFQECVNNEELILTNSFILID